MYTRFDYLVKHMPRFMTNACCRNVCLRVRNARLHLAHSTMMMAQHGAQFVRERNSVLCCECAAIDLFAVLRLGASVSVTHMLLPHETAHHSVANAATHKPGMPVALVRNLLLPSTGLLPDVQPHVPLVLVQK